MGNKSSRKAQSKPYLQPPLSTTNHELTGFLGLHQDVLGLIIQQIDPVEITRIFTVSKLFQNTCLRILKATKELHLSSTNITEPMVNCYLGKLELEKLNLRSCTVDYSFRKIGLLSLPLREIHISNIDIFTKRNCFIDGLLVPHTIVLPPSLVKFTLHLDQSSRTLPIILEFSSCKHLEHFEIICHPQYIADKINIIFADDLTSLKTFILDGNAKQIHFGRFKWPASWYSELETIHLSQHKNWPFSILSDDGQLQLDTEKCPKCTDFRVLPRIDS